MKRLGLFLLLVIVSGVFAGSAYAEHRDPQPRRDPNRQEAEARRPRAQAPPPRAQVPASAAPAPLPVQPEPQPFQDTQAVVIREFNEDNDEHYAALEGRTIETSPVEAISQPVSAPEDDQPVFRNSPVAPQQPQQPTAEPEQAPIELINLERSDQRNLVFILGRLAVICGLFLFVEQLVTKSEKNKKQAKKASVKA